MTTPPLEVTTDAIRSLTIYAAMQDPAGTEEQAGAIFDQWLARVIRQAKAEALREAAAEILPPYNCELNYDGSEDPDAARYVALIQGVHARLTARASRIEAGE